MRKEFYITTFVIFMITNAMAQEFNLSAEIRPRLENKNGYKTLSQTGADAANFVSQRTRLNFGFKKEKIKFFVSFQNVRVWGDVGTLSATDNANAFHQAWVETLLSNKLSIKLGRQEIVYDDHRIFGNVGWAQQARSHDAFIFKYTPNSTNRLDVGFALNSDSQSNLDILYSNVAGYKSFQYAWYHGKFNHLGLSMLLLNTGVEYDNDPTVLGVNQVIDYMQTIGTRITYSKGKFNGNAAVYFQSGKKRNNTVNALYYTGNLRYKILGNFSVAVGIEYLSGKDQNDISTDINSFAPLFGTNHKFNGWMDYFYVGNHGGSVGLTDINFTIAYAKDKFSTKVVPHFFSAPADVYNGAVKMDGNLGTEIDFTMGYKIAKDLTLSAGYSKMLATDTMEILKGGDKDENNSWGWMMLVYKPMLFSSSTK